MVFNVLVTLLMSFFSQTVFAQNIQKQPPQSALEGEIYKVTKEPMCVGSVCRLGIVLNLTQKRSSNIDLFLGAEWKKDQEKAFRPGQTVSAIGVKIEFQGNSGYLIRQLEIAERKFVLPQEIGFPMWYPAK